MSELLSQAGLEETSQPQWADLLIVNTCGFIGPAKEESLTALRQLSRGKRAGQTLIAAGCLVERTNGALEQLVPGLDAVLSTRHWHAVVPLVKRLSGAEARDIPASGPVELVLPNVRRKARGASAYLKIADGCSAPCAFCTIPSIKGAWQSKPVEAIVGEARQLVEQGVKEIILIAQDTTAYGYDRGERDALAPLVESIVRAVPELSWLRLMYAYPGRVTPRLVATMAGAAQVCHYLDVPLQHGHPAVLRRMKRPDLSVARRTIHALRRAMPDIALRTTFIVGYPGETEDEFQALLDFMTEMEFDKVGVFTYCREPGTPAAELPGQLDAETQAERRARAMELQQKISRAKNQQCVGRELDVLIEGVGDGLSVGRSYRDAPEVDGVVLLPGQLPIGEMVRGRVTRALEYDLVAEVVRRR